MKTLNFLENVTFRWLLTKSRVSNTDIESKYREVLEKISFPCVSIVGVRDYLGFPTDILSNFNGNLGISYVMFDLGSHVAKTGVILTVNRGLPQIFLCYHLINSLIIHTECFMVIILIQYVALF